MSVDAHRHAERLMAEADRLNATGLHEAAKTMYLLAAEQEAEGFRQIPASRPRTRGIIAVGVISLFRNAEALEHAKDYADAYLAGEDLPDFAASQLRSLRDEVTALLLARTSETQIEFPKRPRQGKSLGNFVTDDDRGRNSDTETSTSESGKADQRRQ